MNIIALIPARYQSSRLPGKPLLKFGEFNMIQRVYKQTIKAELIKKAYVVTDDERISNSIKQINGNVIMVKENCINGTERICIALEKLKDKYDLIVNVQGDEPFIYPQNIDLAIQQMIDCKNKDCVCTTLHYQVKDMNELTNTNIGKLVLDKNNYILYCSRNCIPFNKNGDFKNGKYYGHIGLFVFKPEYLKKYMLENTPNQLEEDIEWLKILEQGYKILSCLVKDFEIGVNTKEDYNFLTKKFKFDNDEKMNSPCIILYGSILNDKYHLEQRLIYYKKFFQNIIFITYEILVIEYNVKDILLKYINKENLILIPSNRTGEGIENATKYTPFQVTQPKNTFFYDGSLACNYVETDKLDKRRYIINLFYVIYKYFQDYGKKYEYYCLLRHDEDKSFNHEVIDEMIDKAKKNKLVLYSSRPINEQKQNTFNSKNNFYIKQPYCGKDTMYIGFNLTFIFANYETIYDIYDTLWKNINDLNYKMLKGDGEGWFLTKYILIKENVRFIEEELRETIVYKYCDFISEDSCFWTHRYHITWGDKLKINHYKYYQDQDHPCLYCRRSHIFERKENELCPNLLFGFEP